MPYYSKGKVHTIQLGDKQFNVDSLLEARVLTWLCENNYSFERDDKGVSREDSRYTPDVWLSVQLGEYTHRAMVEIKPAKSFFTPYIWRRMVKASRKYTDLLLLYVDDTKTWYRISKKEFELTEFGIPAHGKIPVDKLYHPPSMKAKSVYNHEYKQAVEPGRRVGSFLLNTLVDSITALSHPPGKRGKRRRRRR